MYYLQSRYYDPEVGRFLSADTLILTAFGLVGYNQFAYCINNPICYHDSDGNMPEEDCITEDPEEILFPDKDAVGAPTTSGSSSPGGGPGTAPSSGNPGSGCVRIGGGHGNPVHSGRIESTMDELMNTGKYEVIYGNRALSTAGLNGSQRPDIIAVNRDGTVEVWEFASPSQALGTPGYLALVDKIGAMSSANPGVIFHNIVPW